MHFLAERTIVWKPIAVEMKRAMFHLHNNSEFLQIWKIYSEKHGLVTLTRIPQTPQLSFASIQELELDAQKIEKLRKSF